MSGAAAIDSIGPTEAKVTPIMTGSRMPTPGKPIHCTSVARPQANRSALIRNATSSGGSFNARPDDQGHCDRPGIHHQHVLQAERQKAWRRQYLIDRMDFGAHEQVPPGGAFHWIEAIQGLCQALIAEQGLPDGTNVAHYRGSGRRTAALQIHESNGRSHACR